MKTNNGEKALEEKVWSLCWDAELIQRSATEKRLYRILPPSQRDRNLEETLGIRIVYDEIPNPVNVARDFEFEGRDFS